MKELKVRLTCTEELLGTANGDPNIHEEFIASKAPDAKTREEEVESLGVEGVVEKSKTVFSRTEDGRPMLWDYQIKGFFKDACQMLKKVAGTESSKIKAYKKEIDGTIFVMPRMIPLILPDGEDITICQRPLRAQTAQGERVALASSEEAPAGTQIEFEILMLNEDLEPAVLEWLEYGQLNGIGQWHNSGKGRFTTQIIG